LKGQSGCLAVARQALAKRKTAFIRIDGSTDSGKRHALVMQFQEKKDVRVAVLSIKAAGAGLTLTAASTVVFGELSWCPGALSPAHSIALPARRHHPPTHRCALV